MTTIFASVCLLVIIFLIPETYSPAILVAKAARVRKETGDERYYAPLEKAERNLKNTLEGILLKPFVMLCKPFHPRLSCADDPVQEPMLLATTLYMSYIYGIVYLLVSPAKPHIQTVLISSSRPSHSSSLRIMDSMSVKMVYVS